MKRFVHRLTPVVTALYAVSTLVVLYFICHSVTASAAYTALVASSSIFILTLLAEFYLNGELYS